MKRALIAFVLLAIASVPLIARQSKKDMTSHLSPALELALSKQRKVDVLVVLKDQVSPQTLETIGQQKFTQSSLRTQTVFNSLKLKWLTTQPAVLQWLGTQGLKYRSYYLLNAIAISDIDAEQLASLQEHFRTDKIYLDAPFSPDLGWKTEASDDSETGKIETSLTAVHADRVWNELKVTGKGIVVAGQDTGVDVTHPALHSKYRGYNTKGNDLHDYNWHDAIAKPIGSSNSCGYALKAPCDDQDHGTHTIGTVVGATDDHVYGMAPDAQWIACRNMDGGIGRPSTYLECFEFLMAPYPIGSTGQKEGKPEFAAHVINNSWGCPESEMCKGSEMVQILTALKAAGIMVVASAGNDGPGCQTIQDQPATISPFTLRVGAWNHTSDRIASFSSRGPSTYDGAIGPDIVAPGENILSATPGNTYQRMSGTSMAGPHVVGLVALMWSANEKLVGHIDATIDLIRKTASPRTSSQECNKVKGTAVPNNTFGYGVFDAYNAVLAAKDWQAE